MDASNLKKEIKTIISELATKKMVALDDWYPDFEYLISDTGVFLDAVKSKLDFKLFDKEILNPWQWDYFEWIKPDTDLMNFYEVRGHVEMFDIELISYKMNWYGQTNRRMKLYFRYYID